MLRINRYRTATVGALAAAGAAGTLIAGGVWHPFQSNQSGQPPGTCVSTTENGVVFSFTQAVTCGQFVTGSWYVIAPVTITSITPDITVGAATENGWEANPASVSQSYDSRATTYSAAVQPTLPYAAAANTSIVKTVSLPSLSGFGANGTYIDKAVVLTVLGSVPPNDAFRPSYFGSTKTIYRQSNVNMSLLPSLAAPAGNSGPSLANVEERYQQVQLDHSWGTAASGRPSPLASFHQYGSPSISHVYGENIAIDSGEAVLRTFLNDSNAAKTNAVNDLVQAGIDYAGVAANLTVASSGGGGHQGGRKILTAYAGWLLNDTTLKNIAGTITGQGWGEDYQFYWSSSAGGTGSHFVNQPAGMALFGYVNQFSKPFPYSGSGAKDIRDSSSMVDGGLSTTGPAPANTLGFIPATTADYQAGLYIDIASTHALLVATICGIVPALRTIFNYDPEIFYADRVWEYGVWSSPDGSPSRDLGAPVRALSGTLSHGALIAASYGSSFGNAMRTAYYPDSANTYLGGSGGSGLASGLTSLSDTALPLQTSASVDTGANATAYYQIYKPASLSGSGPWPLVIWGVGSAGSNCLGAGIPAGYSLTMANCILASISATNGNDMQAAADTNGFILIAPFVDFKPDTGVSTGSHPYGGNYNTDGCPGGVCGTADYFNPKQFYYDALLYAENHTNIDLSRIYVGGDSAGGNFAESIICQSPSWSTPGATYHRSDNVPALLNAISGVGMWSGSLASVATNTAPLTSGTGAPLCNPTFSSHPVSIFRTMGTTDSIEGYDSSHLACASRTVGSFCYIGFANETSYDITKMGLSATPTSGPTTDTGLSGTASVITTTYATGGFGGKALQTVVSTGSGHDGLIYKRGCTPAATTCTYNVPNRMFAFWQAH